MEREMGIGAKDEKRIILGIKTNIQKRVNYYSRLWYISGLITRLGATPSYSYSCYCRKNPPSFLPAETYVMTSSSMAHFEPHGFGKLPVCILDYSTVVRLQKDCDAVK